MKISQTDDLCGQKGCRAGLDGTASVQLLRQNH